MSLNIKDIFNRLLEKHKDFDVIKNLGYEEIEKLKEINNSIKTNELYNYLYHGVHHSQKVLLFAYLIGKEQNLNDEDMHLLLDAAIYHDIGRESDQEETFHGYVSAMKIDTVIDKNFYSNNYNLNILKAICDGHSRDDKHKENVANDYDIPSHEYQRYSKLYDILKDADALDRTRFKKTSVAAIKEEFLRLDYSKSLVQFAIKVNKYFGREIDSINFNKYESLYSNTPKDNSCFHGIGWDFSKLESILQNGIMSSYRAEIEGINISRNFEGNNSNMWISVIDSEDVKKNDEAYKKFVNNNIVFYAFSGRYHKGTKSISEALSSGLPIKTSLYNDESFVFDKIDKENIYGFVLPKDSANLTLNQLQYLDCSRGYSTMENRVQSYFDYIEKICGITPDSTKARELIEELKQKELDYEKLSSYEQKKSLKSFIDNIDISAELINNEIATWMNNSFKVYLGIEEDPTVEMVIEDILKRNDINYQIMNPEETIYKVNFEKKKDNLIV